MRRGFSLHPYLAPWHLDVETGCQRLVQPARRRGILTLLHLPLDLYEHKFINCRFINSTFLEQKEGCHLDFEQDNDFLIYLVSFLGSLSVLPGNIISALLMDRIGRLKMIGELSGTAHLCSRGPGKGLRVC